MSNEAAERLRDDKVRRDFLDELIFTGVVQTPMSYDEIKAVTDSLDSRIRLTERKATVERIKREVLFQRTRLGAPPEKIRVTDLLAILDAEAAR